MSCIWDILFSIYLVSKSSAAKPQNFGDISGALKTTWAKFGDFEFFFLKREGYIDITRAKINLGSHDLHVRSYSKIIDKVVFRSPKTGQK